MNLDRHKRLFNNISLIYNWFYKKQLKGYSKTLSLHIHELEIPIDGRILDVGCGTGALTMALSNRGYQVTGIDLAEKMFRYGKERGLDCRHGNMIEGLDFEDKSFDLVTSAYVAHGLDRDKRAAFFKEAARLSRGRVLFHDYSSRRNSFISLIEALEGGDYFNFIRSGLQEMEEIFSSVKVVQVRTYNNWYICTP